MNTCGTCKYWGTDKEVHDTYRTCGAVIHDEDSKAEQQYYDTPIDERDWLTEEQKQELRDFRTVNKAIVVDGSGYFAALRSREDFGCILHEFKE